MNFILGTAGHIDHGKSSLVQALTGTNPDRLPEEKKRGVTIELGFAHLSLSGPNGEKQEIGVVDVPGHADFVNNMVAGVGALDAALLVVAADDGWMPQSEEHLHILSYLGITQVVIALTKIDLSDDPEFAAEFVRDSLSDTSFAEAPIIPVSSKTGEGMDQVRAAISELLANAKPHEDLGTPILPVDRAFSLKGLGTVVTGTLSRGNLQVGDEVTLQPDGLIAHVRSIQNHNETLELAKPGMRTAVSLPDVPVKNKDRKGASRGQVLTSEKAGITSDTFDIEVSRLARPIPAQSATERPLKNNAKVRVHYGSGFATGRIRLTEGELLPGQKALAQLRLDAPLFAIAHDRLVIRDWSGEATLAGAVVLDPLTSRRQSNKDTHRELLAKLSANLSPASRLAFLLKKHRFLPERPNPQAFPYSNRSFKDAVKELSKQNQLIKSEGGLFDASWWEQLLAESTEHVIAFHKQNPDLPGLPLLDLKKALPRSLPEALFPPLIEALKTKDIVANGEHLSSLHHSSAIPPELEQAAERILSTLLESGLTPPNRKDLAPSADEQRALAFLIRVGSILSLDEKTVLHGEIASQTLTRIQNFLKTAGQATASELRQHLETSRKVIVPLLEHMDQQGLTKRDGDYRKLVD